jgi:hypothetical protein
VAKVKAAATSFSFGYQHEIRLGFLYEENISWEQKLTQLEEHREISASSVQSAQET